MCKLVSCIIVILFASNICFGSRILVVFPMPSRSHAILSDSIVNEFLDAGHEVTYVNVFSNEKSRDRLTCINISSIVNDILDQIQLNVTHIVRNPYPLHLMMIVRQTFTQRALEHEAVQRILNDPSITFDAVVAEWFYSGLLAPLAAVYSCPLIWYSAQDVSWMVVQLVHEQSNPAYGVDLQARNMASITFAIGGRAYQLMRQTYLSVWMYGMSYYVEKPAYFKIYKKLLQLRGLMIPSYQTLVYNGSFLLINSHLLLGQGLPLPENAKYIGGHHIDEHTVPLPKNLQQILDNATHGAILFSMGTSMRSEDLQNQTKRDLVRMFGQLKQTVIWKSVEHIKDFPRNIHLFDWVPQQSILNHSNTVLLICHGGFLSNMESIFYGVPIIGIPVFGDGFVATDLAVARGRGIRVDYSEDLPSQIGEAIKDILGNSSYRINAKQTAVVIKRNLQPPRKELLHWINLVIETRGALHLRSAAHSISIIQQYNLDILIAIVILYILYKVVTRIKDCIVLKRKMNEKIN